MVLLSIKKDLAEPAKSSPVLKKNTPVKKEIEKSETVIVKKQIKAPEKIEVKSTMKKTDTTKDVKKTTNTNTKNVKSETKTSTKTVETKDTKKVVPAKSKDLTQLNVTSTNRNYTVYHVTKRDNDGREWKVFIQGSSKVIKLFSTQAEALEYAKDLCKSKDDGSYVMLHGLDGKIRKF